LNLIYKLSIPANEIIDDIWCGMRGFSLSYNIFAFNLPSQNDKQKAKRVLANLNKKSQKSEKIR